MNIVARFLNKMIKDALDCFSRQKKGLTIISVLNFRLVTQPGIEPGIQP